jgi:hypothetical protein
MLVAFSPSVLRWGGACLLAAAPLTAVQRSHVTAHARSVATWYDRSRQGQRLGTRLKAAAIELPPSRWRANQALLIPPCALWAWTFTGSVVAGLSLASLFVRGGGAALLRMRRHRRDTRLEEAAVLIARHLATELGAGASPGDVCAALKANSALEARPVAAELTAATAARVSTGEPMSVVLASVARAEPSGAGRAALLRLATLVELATAGGAGTLPLARFAAGVEAHREATAAARAVVAEVRMAAVAIPVLSCLVALTLATAEPSITAAALSLPLLPVLAACSAVCAAGAVLVRRLTWL